MPTSGTTLKPTKPYNFAIGDASDRSMTLVLAISEHTTFPAVNSSLPVPHGVEEDQANKMR